jgi:hypothetical protein
MITPDFASNVRVIEQDGGQIVLGIVTGTPPTTANKFRPGCILIQGDAAAGSTGIYQNTATAASPTWTLLNTGTTLTLSGALTVGGTSTLTGAVTATAGVQSTPVAVTATADGLTTGIIPAGTSWATVTSANADHIVTLPAPVVGNVIRLKNGATGYELRSSTPASIAINGGTGASAESAVIANQLLEARCTSATTWVISNYHTDGTESKLEAAA